MSGVFQVFDRLFETSLVFDEPLPKGKQIFELQKTSGGQLRRGEFMTMQESIMSYSLGIDRATVARSFFPLASPNERFKRKGEYNAKASC